MRPWIALALVASPALAQTDTNCSSMGGNLHCQTTPGLGSSVPNVGQNMLDSMAAQTRQNQQTQATRQLQQDALKAQAGNSAADRRAAAYAQVGQLIAGGQCDQAKRLAKFYNHDDIIKDTAKACP